MAIFSLQIYGIKNFYILENLFANCTYLIFWFGFLSPKICVVIDGDKFLGDKEPWMFLRLHEL